MLSDFNIHGVSFFGTPLPIDSQLESSLSHWLPSSMKNVSKIRQQEFIAGRFCAAQAAKVVGINLLSLPSAKSREPIWPLGLVGSIAHSKKLAVSCVSLSEEHASIGVDAEELIERNICLDITTLIAEKAELTLLNNFDSQIGLTILFSAKEALYKALFPLARTFIDFKEVKLISLDTDKGLFELLLKSSNAKLKSFIGNYKGSFKQIDETIVTVVSIPKMVTKEHYVYS